MTLPVQRQIPEASDLQAFDHAVAGHAGTMRDISGAMFIKPCVQKEIDFYEEVNAKHPKLARIMPVFIGKLRLYGDGTSKTALKQITESPSETETETPLALTPAPKNTTEWVKNGSGSINTDRAIVLENITHGYRHPNILDVKLGKRLYADGAAEKKIEHMKQISDQTTHKNLGFRIAGMRVWNGEGTADTASKSASQSGSKKASTSVRIEKGYSVYDKDYGRKEVNDGNIVEAFRRFVFNEAAGIDEEHGRAVAAAFKADLENIRDVLENERTCMFSSSLLFVFEGDGDALKIAIAENNRAAAAADGDDDDASSRESSVEPAMMAAPVSINALGDLSNLSNLSNLGNLGQAMGIQMQEIQEIRALQSRQSPQKRRRIQSPTPADEPEATFEEQVEGALQSLRASSRRVVLGKAGDRSSSRTDSGIAIDDEDEQDEQDCQDNLTGRIDHIVTESFTMEDEADGSASTTDTETSSEPGLPPLRTLRLIDFAHARFVDEADGPDENNLLGVRKLIEVFDELSK